MSDRIAAPRPEERVAGASGGLAQPWMRWVLLVTQILAGNRPLQLAAHTVAGLPDAAAWKHCTVVVTDEAGGAVTAFSDGTNWRRSTDRAVVS